MDDAAVDQMENYLTIYYYIDVVFRGEGGEWTGVDQASSIKYDSQFIVASRKCYNLYQVL